MRAVCRGVSERKVKCRTKLTVDHPLENHGRPLILGNDETEDEMGSCKAFMDEFSTQLSTVTANFNRLFSLSA